jgi:hypothetical protein
MADYLPYSDVDFSTWIDQFVSYLGPHVADFGMVAEDIADLVTGRPAWHNALEAHLTARTAAKTACLTKNDNRTSLTAIVRALAARINAYPGTTDVERELLGLKPKESDGYTADTFDASEDRPSAVIDITPRLRHILRVENQTSTGTTKGKPAGVLGAEVWCKIGSEPAGDGSDAQYLGMVTRNPFVVNYAPGDAGKTAYFMLRWTTRTGEKSNWSETETATIAA